MICTGAASYVCLVPFSIRTEAMTIWPLVAAAPLSVFLALSATLPAISTIRPSSNSAASSRVNRWTAGGSVVVADGVGLGVASRLGDGGVGLALGA